MALAETLIDDYVRAGFRKIHLDCSMSCAGDPAPLGMPRLPSVRRACARWRSGPRRRAAAKRRFMRIGTEVPVPGGAQEAQAGLQVTTPQAVAQTLETHRIARQKPS